MSVIDDQVSQDGRRDRWIPWGFVVFFLIVFSVNGIFIYKATTSWVGLVTENPYERGLNYNDVLRAKAEQLSLGWTHTISYADKGRIENRWSGDLSVTLQQKSGEPLSGIAVKAVVVRPGRFSQAFPVSLRETKPGTYSATVELPLPGQWHIQFSGQRGEEEYHSVDTFFVEPN